MRSTPALSSETLAAIEALRFVVERFAPRNIALPEELESARMLRGLAAAEAPPAPPSADFLEKLRRNLVAASRSRRIAMLPPKELRYAPWLLWNGKPPGASLPGLLPALLDHARTSAPTLRRLIGAYLRDFDPRATGIDDAAARIRDVLARGEPRFGPWRRAQTEVHLFDPARGPAALADRLLDDERPDETLARYKLDAEMLATGNYMMAVEDAIRAAAPLLLRTHAELGLHSILRIVEPADKLRFPSRIGDTGRALLRAWLDRGPEPATTVQQPVREILLRWLGDPRLRPQRWVALGEQEAALMRRWLTRASLDLFFRLIDQHALEEHWRYRHAFWLAYLEKGAIADAWLALGREAHDSAVAIRELGGAYGRLRGPGVTANQSALLLRIGPLVISEFTHNGKLRIWPAEWRNTPQLGLQEYGKAYLVAKCLPFPPNPYRGKGGAADGKGLSHFQSQQSYWQGSAAVLIESRTGYKITRIDWRPK
jgi:EH_Signature domain